MLQIKHETQTYSFKLDEVILMLLMQSSVFCTLTSSLHTLSMRAARLISGCTLTAAQGVNNVSVL